MAITSSQVSVTTTATPIITGGGTVTDTHPIIIRNADAAVSVFLGGAGVTSGNGFELVAGAAIPGSLLDSDTIYGRTTSGTVRVDVLKARQ